MDSILPCMLFVAFHAMEYQSNREKIWFKNKELLKLEKKIINYIIVSRTRIAVEEAA